MHPHEVCRCVRDSVVAQLRAKWEAEGASQMDELIGDADESMDGEPDEDGMNEVVVEDDEPTQCPTYKHFFSKRA